MSNIVIFGAPHSGKTTLLGYLSTAMLRHPQLNEEILQRLKLIKKLGMRDDFHIGDVYNPVHICKDIILPSFVSLDRDELRKFSDKKETTIGGSKRLHHKQLTICMSERKDMWNGQNENENISCTFVDLPGFRQRISDKYKGFFEGDVGLAMLDVAEVIKLDDAIKHVSSKDTNLDYIYKQERKLFEPVRIWCDYHSPAHLLIAISKIDQKLIYNGEEEDFNCQLGVINRAIECVRGYTKKFGGQINIPVVPISIRITQEKNYKKNPRMKVFFHREEENIYAKPEGKTLPGDGTLISCLKRLLEPYVKGEERMFSMASVNRPMQTRVNYARKTALQVRTIHGTLHETDSVLLGPILNKKTNEICYAKCAIASLKADGAKDTSPMLLEGNVGGVIFKSITSFEGRPSEQYILSSIPSETDIKILKSTIMFSGEVARGDIIALKILKKEYLTVNGEVDVLYTNVLGALMPNDEMILFWYGKKIPVKVIEIFFKPDELNLSLVLPNNQQKVPHFALPCNSYGKILHHDNVLLAISEANYLVRAHSNEPTYTYVSASVYDIKDSSNFDTICIEGNSSLSLSEILRGSLPLVSEEKIGREYSVEAILASINKNIKNNFNRFWYKRAGGIRMYLVKNDE